MASAASSWWTRSESAGGSLGPAANGVLLGLCAALLSVFLLWRRGSPESRKRAAPLPPGPRGLPLLGVLPFLEPQLHRCFAAWARRYGAIVSFRLGSRQCVLLSSASALEEVLARHDIAFSDRDVPASAPPLTYGGINMLFSPYGPAWRSMRKVAVQEVLSRRNLEAVSWLRRRGMRRLVWELRGSCGTPVELGERVFLMAVDMMTNMLWGSSMEEGAERGGVGKEFRDVVDTISNELSRPNLSDFFPVLSGFDLQGIERRMKECAAWYDRVADKIVMPRLEAARHRGGGGRSDGAARDFLDVMLDIVLRGDTEEPFTINHVKVLLLELVAAGSETMSTTVEWTMAELLANPKIMKRVQEELDSVVGRDKAMEESHIEKLQYLAAVMKEAQRLHPPITLMLPRCPREGCIVGGYTIPKGARVFVNAWAIHRDPSVWDDPEHFKPERFLSATKGLHGNNSSYLPFGFGRRMCAGMQLGEKMTMYTLASLLHPFEWQMKDGEEVDLSDKFGASTKKAQPLAAVPAPRLAEESLYT